MIPDLEDDYIIKAIDSLEQSVGIKERLDPWALHHKDDLKCVENIARHFGLPIAINLIYVSEHYSSHNTTNFRSRSVVLAEEPGSGKGSGIVAQVNLPASLPMYGSEALDGFQIDIHVSGNANKYPATFMALMAHELSHVLLYALRHPEKESEIYTDLVPLLLGLESVVRKGRQTRVTTTSGNTQTTTTTTYGYLTKEQIYLACKEIDRRWNHHNKIRTALIGSYKITRLLHEELTRKLIKIDRFLQYLDRKQPGRIKPDDAQKLVAFHQPGYTEAWKHGLKKISGDLDCIDTFLRGMCHFNHHTLVEMRKHDSSLNLHADTLHSIDDSISACVLLLSKYTPLYIKLLNR